MSDADQFQLFAPRNDAEKVQWLLDLLADGNWHHAAEALNARNMPPTEGAKRMIREAAELSEGRVISGQKGYKLTAHATAEEIDHFTRQLRSQAAKMTRRVIAAQNFFYRRPRVASNGTH